MHRRRNSAVIAALLAAALSIGAITVIDLAHQVKGVLGVANGGLNTATVPSTSGQIPIYDTGSGAYVPGDPLVQGLTAHDAAGTSTNPVAVGGFASATAPSDVSTDTDIVRGWFRRNGAQVNDIYSFNGTAVDTNSGNKSAGTLRVVIATDQPSLTNALPVSQNGTWTVQPGNTANTTAWLVRRNDGTNSELLDPCQTVAKSYVAISQTSGTQIISGTSAKKTYICAINLVTATAQNIALVGGTGTVCATGTHAIAGGTTAATGWNLAASGGLTQGDGNAALMQASTNADNICILQSGSGQISGAISYVQQ